MKARQLTILAVAAIMLTSTMGVVAANAHGTWYGGSGVLEPSTSYDTPEFMWQTANQQPVDRIYFNGFLVNGRIPSAIVQLEGGSVEAGNDIYFGAMLGFWRDCNKDGYIGDKNVPASYGNWAAGDYPADASSVDHPVDGQICPIGTVYNSGIIVDEFRWIGPSANIAKKGGCPTEGGFVVFNCWSSDQGEVSDEKAYVWADFGRPDDIGTRGEALLARYTLDNSSSTLDRVDRFAGASDAAGRVDPALKAAYDQKPTLGECDSPENREFLGGPDGQCGLYPLWQAKRLVNDSDSREEHATPIVTVYDTETDDDASGSTCDDTTLPNGMMMADVQPSVSSDPVMDGSLAGTLVNVREGTGNLEFDGSCGGYSGPNLEHDRAITEGKDAVSAELGFNPGKEFTGLSPLGIRAVPMDGLGFTGGPNGPHDSPYAGMSGGSKWISLPHYVGNTPPVLEPIWTTMYADVSPLTFSNSGASVGAALPAGVQDAHTYGGPQCGNNFDDTPENREPNALGWICSKVPWDAARRVDGSAWSNMIIGDSYDLRDVDCYDMTLTTIDGQRIGAPGVHGLNGEPIREACGTTILG